MGTFAHGNPSLSGGTAPLPQTVLCAKGNTVYSLYNPEIWFIDPGQDPGCSTVISPRVRG